MPNVPASCGRVVNCGLDVTAASRDVADGRSLAGLEAGQPRGLAARAAVLRLTRGYSGVDCAVALTGAPTGISSGK